MTPRLLILVAAWVCAATPVLPARAADDVPLKDVLDADDLRRLGDRVRALQAPIDPKLLEAIGKLLKDYPGLSPDQLARMLLDQRPELLKPENVAQYAKMLEAFAPKSAPPPILTPPIEPPVLPPVPRLPMDPPVVATPPTKPPLIDTPPVKPPVTETLPNLPKTTEPIQQPTQPVPPVAPQLPAAGDQEAQFRAAAGWWEKNVGPLNDSPAVKEMLAEFLKGAGSTDGVSPLASLLKGLKGDNAAGFKDFAKGVLPDGFKFPDLGLEGPKSLPTLPNLPSAAPPAPPNLELGGLRDSWAPVAVGVALALAAFGYFVARPWWRGRAAGLTPTPVPGLGPWPLDPRGITDRDALVQAFDYLSVLTLGDNARQYNHVTVAGELRRLVPAAADVADELGRHYAVARYTPPGEPVGAADLAAARAALCRLAGVPA